MNHEQIHIQKTYIQFLYLLKVISTQINNPSFFKIISKYLLNFELHI